jgi:tetratricopeptide (TPR) repeat protein
MRNAWVILTGVLAGLAAAMVVVFTHDVRIPPAIAAGLVRPPAGVVYDIPPQPTSLEEMEAVLAGEQATHFGWWTFLGEMRLASGDRPGAIRAWQRGAELAVEAAADPAVEESQWRPAYRAGWNYWRLGRQDEANRWMRRALDVFELRARWARTRDQGSGDQTWGTPREDVLGDVPAFQDVPFWDLLFIGRAHKVMGDQDQANDAFAEMMQRQAATTTGLGNGWQYFYNLARFLAMSGDDDSALLAFEAAARHGGFDASNAWWTPSFETIRDDPRFRAVLRGEVPPGDKWPNVGPPIAGEVRAGPGRFDGE